MYGNLLIPEPPLQVLPTLAETVGLNEAIILQQVHYWTGLNERTKRQDTFHEGYYWTFATFDKSEREGIVSWVEQFPFWSEKTIRRAIKRLREKELLVTGNYGFKPTDRTLWYRVDYPRLRAISPIRSKCPDASGHNGRFHPDKVTGSYKETTVRDNGKVDTGFSGPSSLQNPDARRGENLLGEKVSKSKPEAELSGLEALSAFVSVRDQVETLTDGFASANNKVAFLRVAYMQIFGTDEDDTPDYPDIGRLLARARSLAGNERLAGQSIIKHWVTYILSDIDDPDPLTYVHDRIDARRRQSRKKKVSSFTLPDHAAAVAYYEKHRYGPGVKFEEFFKPVDSKGRDWNGNRPENKGQKPRWKLIASKDQMKSET